MRNTHLILLMAMTLTSYLTAQDGGKKAADALKDTVREMRTQPQDVAPPDDQGHPVLDMIRAAEPPEIDGILGDPAWETAAIINRLIQAEPHEGAEPSQYTEIRILYDADFLYLGLRCDDKNSSNIVAKQMLRDGDMDSDDRVTIVVDTFHDHRNGFYFQINANGTRRDALVQTGRRPNTNWDGIWYGKARITDAGWEAEVAIPFKTVGFDPDGTTWGFNIERRIRHTNERVRWAGARRNLRVNSMGDAGVLANIKAIAQGLGLDVSPFVTLKHRHDLQNDREVFTWDPGLNAFYKITPGLTAALTVNTDFAETEVDERQVNLTRFPLFFPEKRDFFLQDASIFEFADIRFSPIPFFSRRIGISSGGKPVDIYAGLKVTGRVDNLNIGVLSVQQRAHDGISSRNLSVARASLNIFEESDVGLLVTAGDPNSNDNSFLFGGDFRFRKSNVLGNKVVTASAWVQHTLNEGVNDRQSAWGAKIDWPNDTIDVGIGYFEIMENFDPALGFVRRTGVREFFGNGRYRWRPEESFIRTVDVGFFSYFTLNRKSNEMESAFIKVKALTLGSQDGDELELNYLILFEGLNEDFDIRDDVIIPTGEYWYNRFELKLETSNARFLAGNAEVEIGEFYNGTRFDASVGLELRPSKYFFAMTQMATNSIHLPGGSFLTRIIRFQFNILFTPDVSWNTLVQYDNVSDSAGINSRFRWILEPGREFFFVINQGFDVDNWSAHGQFTEAAVKLGWTFRF